MLPIKKTRILLACLFLVISCNSVTSENEQKENEKVSSVINYLNENPNSTYVYKEGQYVTSQAKLDLSHEAVYSEQNADFVAVKNSTVPCVGCPFDLNLEVKGVSTLVDLALRHVESEHDEKHALVRVIRLQQQIVAGVKYILLLEIAPTVCPKGTDSQSCPTDYTKGTVVCEVIYLEKPWLSTAKHIISNNCTKSQEYWDKVKPKPVPTNNRKEITDDFLAELEAQIIPTIQNNVHSVQRPLEPQPSPNLNEIEEPLNKFHENVPILASNLQLNNEATSETQKPVDIQDSQRTKNASEETEVSTVASLEITQQSPSEAVMTTEASNRNENDTDTNNSSQEYSVINVSRSKREMRCKKKKSSKKRIQIKEISDNNIDEDFSSDKSDDDSNGCSNDSDDSDDSSENKNNDNNSDSNDSDTDDSTHKRKLRKSKEKNDDSSSSSSSDESNGNEISKAGKSNNDDDSSSSSSSSSESDDCSCDKHKRHHKHKHDSSSQSNDESSSSSSSESDDDEKTKKSKNVRNCLSSESSSSSSDDSNSINGCGTHEKSSKKGRKSSVDSDSSSTEENNKKIKCDSDSSTTSTSKDSDEVKHDNNKSNDNNSSDDSKSDSSQEDDNQKNQIESSQSDSVSDSDESKSKHKEHRQTLKRSDESDSRSNSDETRSKRSTGSDGDSDSDSDSDGSKNDKKLLRTKRTNNSDSNSSSDSNTDETKSKDSNSKSDSSSDESKRKNQIEPRIKRSNKSDDDSDSDSDSDGSKDDKKRLKRSDESYSKSDSRSNSDETRSKRSTGSDDDSDSDSDSDGSKDDKKSFRTKRSDSSESNSKSDSDSKDDKSKDSDSKSDSDSNESKTKNERTKRSNGLVGDSDSDSDSDGSKDDKKSLRLKRSDESDSKSDSRSNSDETRSKRSAGTDGDSDSDSDSDGSKDDKKSLRTKRSNSSDSNSKSDSDSKDDKSKDSDSKSDSNSDESKTKNERTKRSNGSVGDSDSDSDSDGSKSKNEKKLMRIKRSDSSDSSSSNDSNSKDNSSNSSDSDSNSDESKRKNEKQSRKKHESESNSSKSSKSEDSKNKDSSSESSKSSKSESKQHRRASSTEINPDEHQGQTQDKRDLLNDIDQVPYIVKLNRRKRFVGYPKSFTEDQKMEVKKLIKIAGKTLGAGKSKIHLVSVKKLKMDGTYYRLKLRFDNKACIVIMHLEDDNVKTLKSQCKGNAISPSKKNSNIQKREVVPGGIQSLNDYSDIKPYLNDGLDYLDSKSPHSNRYKIQEILQASTQVVSGQLIRVKAKVILSDCEKGNKKSIEQCGEKSNEESRICHFKIWDQPWIPKGRETNITCENEPKSYSYRSRRSADEEEDLEDPDFVNQQLFGSFMETYNKTYMNKVEYYYRFKVFKDNLNTIRLLNKFEQGTALYAITRFADLTKEEFSKRHGLRWDLKSENEIPFEEATIPNIILPSEFDWRTKNAVTEVKDQGSCGSCWAFSTTGNIEGQYAIKYKKLLEFSEQELVDCDKTDEGCDGGLMDNAYRAIEKLGGLETEQDYPYDADDDKCSFNKNKVKVKLSGALNISHDETDMAKWLVQNGPISIAINANAMQFYAGGVSHPWKMLCNPKNLDHGVLIVGYGVHTYPRFNKTLPFWIVKNSWGPSWGEQGYYRVYRGDGTCGLNQTPSSAIVA